MAVTLASNLRFLPLHKRPESTRRILRFSSILSLLICAMLAGAAQAQVTTEVTVPVTVVAQGPLAFQVYFNDAVTGFDAAGDVSVSLTGTAAVGGINVSANSQQNYTVELSSITGDGTLQLTIPAGVATSTTTTDTNLAVSSGVITVDNTKPVVVTGALSRTSATTLSATPITFDVSFTGASNANLAPADVLVSASGTAEAIVSTTTPFGTAFLPTPSNPNLAPASRPHDSSFDIDVKAGLTIEAWVKPPSGTDPGFVVNYDSFAGYGMRLDPGADPGTMNLVFSLGFADFATSTAPVRAGAWNHLACSLNSSGEIRLYVDGVEQAFYNGYIDTLTYGTDPLTVGYRFFNPAPSWPASIDELRIWSVARSAAELAAGMSAPLAGTPAGLLGYWRFDALEDLGVGPNSGSNDIGDLSGHSRHLDTEPGVSLVESNALYGATVSLSNFAGDGSLSVSMAAGIAADAAGNQSNAKTISPSISVAMSATAPQIVSITPDVSSPTNADAITFRVVFSEPVTGLASDDLVITQPGVSIVSAVITPIDGSNYDVLVSGIGGNGSLTLGVRAGAVQNSAPLYNTAPANSAPVVIDNNGPYPTLSSAAASPLDGSPFVVNIGFDEVVTGFAVTDLAVSNAVLSNFGGSGSSYTVTVTPIAFGDVTVGPIGFGSVLDLAGNGNSSGNALSYSFPVPDTTPPAITSVIAPAFATTAEFSLEIRFTEEVTGFTNADVAFSTTGTATITGSSLTSLTSYRYRLEVTGAAGQGNLVISIAAGALNDVAGNGNELLTITQPIDQVAPGVASSSFSPLAGAGVGQQITFQVVADEIIHAYDASRITVITTGDVGYVASQTGQVTVEGTVFNLRFSHTGNGTLALQLQPGALIDRAGLASTGTFTTSAVTVDNTPPQLLSLEPLISGRQFAPQVVTFEGVLSEPVASLVQQGLTVDYAFLTVSNPDYPADLNSLVRVGSPEIIAPDRFRIAVDLGRVPYPADFNLWLVANLFLQDAAGNQQIIAGRRSGSPAIIDLLVTKATISTPRKLTNQSPIPINVQFTSATLAGFPTSVTGFDLSDLNITNATASNLTGSGSDYSFELTPTASGEVSLWISPYAARDADNRPNIGTEIFYIDYDITPPVILSAEALTTGNPNNDASFLLAFKVSEPLDRFSLEQAVLVNLVYTGTLLSSVEHTDQTLAGFELVRISNFPGREGTLTFTLPAGSATDLAGNATTAPSALPAPIAVDLVAPTVSTTHTFVAGTNPIDPLSDSISATAVTFEFTFNEPVLDFQEGDIEISRDGPLGYGGTSFVIASPTVGRLTLSNVASDGVLTAKLRANSVTDVVGNGNSESSASINIDNIATEVVSITPDSLELSSDSTSFIVTWSKPVSGFDPTRFALTGFAVTSGSITITPIDSLHSRVDVSGLSGMGEFALEVLDHAAVDRFNNPNFAGATSPTVKRSGLVMFGPYSVLVSGEANAVQAIGAPDLIINGVFALRGEDTGGGFVPARITWDGRFLTLFGRFEILTSPSMALFSGTGIIDSTTGELTSSGFGDLPFSGVSKGLRPCRARLILDNRALRLSGWDLFLEGFFNDVAVDPRTPANQLVLDSLSTFSLGSAACAPTGLTFQVLSFAETARGFAFDVRTLTDLVGDETTEQAFITGRIEYEDSVTTKLSGFNVQASGFDWLPGTAQLLPGKLRFSGLTREQGGMLFEIGAMEITSGLTITLPEALVVSIPCSYDPTSCPNGQNRAILTMNDPVFGQSRITSANSVPLAPGQASTRAEISGPKAAGILLLQPHTLTFGSGTIMNVPDAVVDATAYRAPTASITTNIGTFGYRDLAIFYTGQLSEGTTAITPALTDPTFGGLRVLGMDLPFRINAVHCDPSSTWCRDILNWTITVELPTDFPLQPSAATLGVLEGNNIVVATASEGSWCVGLLPASIPHLNIQLNPFCLKYTDPPPVWVGTLFAVIPVGATTLQIRGEIGIADSKWDSLRLTVSGFEIPVGNSGAYLTAVDAGLSNMAQVEKCVLQPGLVGMTRVCSVEPIEFRGRVDFGAGPLVGIFRMAGASAETWINDERIKVVGDVYLLHPAGIKMAKTTGILTFAGPSFEATSTVAYVPGLYGTASIKIGNLYVNGLIKATVAVPDAVPIIGGFVAGEVGMAVNSSPIPVVKGFIYMFGASFSVAVNTAGNLDFGKRADSLRSWESRNVYQVDADGRMKELADRDTPSFVVMQNFPPTTKQYLTGSSNLLAPTITLDSSSPTVVRLAWANEGAVADFTLVGPNGTLFSPATVETNPNVSAPVGFLQNTAARDATYVFTHPTPGVYMVNVGNAAALGESSLEVRVQNAEPSFEFVNVATTGDQLFLDWKAADADNNAQITFYLDRDREDLNGIQLAGPFSEDSQTATIIDLATVGAAPGTYWVYAQIDDGVNAPKTVYASVPIFFVNPDAPPAIRHIEVVATETTAIVRWEPSSDPGILGYAVKWTTDIEHDMFENSISVEKGLDSLVVSGLTPNTKYKFTVVAIKTGTVIAAKRAVLRDVRDAAEGRPVYDVPRMAYLGDQIARLATSMKSNPQTPSTNLNAYHFGKVTPWSTPLAAEGPNAESLIVEFDIVETVALAGNNNEPEFLSSPARTVVSSGRFEYPVQLRDRDGDTLSLRVVQGPDGMTLQDRLLSWEPAGQQGVFPITLEVSDGIASRTQSWDLTSASLFSDPLRIPAREIGIVPPGVPFAFPIETLGGCGSPVSYRLLTAPAGMTLDGAGLVEWTPPSDAFADAQFDVAASQVCSGRTIEASRHYNIDVEAADGDVGNFIPLPLPPPTLSPGDANGDGSVTASDIFYLINHQFAGGPALIGEGDSNGDGVVNVSDIFYLINYLFAGGQPPI